jgi:hypothetical protein
MKKIVLAWFYSAFGGLQNFEETSFLLRNLSAFGRLLRQLTTSTWNANYSNRLKQDTT